MESLFTNLFKIIQSLSEKLSPLDIILLTILIVSWYFAYRVLSKIWEFFNNRFENLEEQVAKTEKFQLTLQESQEKIIEILKLQNDSQKELSHSSTRIIEEMIRILTILQTKD